MTAFMKPQVAEMTMYHVETNYGTEYVPQDVCGDIDIEGEPTDVIWRNLLACCEGSQIDEVTEHTGWYARLSARGYLDCTDWTGPYASEQEALASICALYEVCENGEPYGYLEDEADACADHENDEAKEGNGR